MRVLVTGGAGFIGSALTRALLARGDEVTVVDNLVTGRREWVPEGARFHCESIGDRQLERVFEDDGPFDRVFHHAALKDVRKALIDPGPDAEANILGTLNVLRCAAEHGTGRIVFPSSAAVYGDAPVRPTPESAATAPISPYGISKLACEHYLSFFAHNRALPAVALRYSTVYGPAAAEESEAGVITIFTRRMLAGRRPVVFGDGEQTRDFVHVDDVVEATLLAAEQVREPWAVYNVCTGVETSLNDLYRALAGETGFGQAAEYLDRKAGEVLRNAQDPSLLAQDLGWRARLNLRDGLRRVVAAYREEMATGRPVTGGAHAPAPAGAVAR
ncbi:MAG TPA: NAD-dependent epimerase/dehydratase family protein [Chloroflexota bacterium]|nr:NAD-dependent epimerase/dehydratase family protein [Chloroflexota bacterium]